MRLTRPLNVDAEVVHREVEIRFELVTRGTPVLGLGTGRFPAGRDWTIGHPWLDTWNAVTHVTLLLGSLLVRVAVAHIPHPVTGCGV